MTMTDEQVNEAYDAWDGFDPATLPWGTVLRFDVVVMPDSIRTYAALLAGDGCWYLTGREAPNGVGSRISSPG